MSELDKSPDVFVRTDVSEQFTDLQDWKKFVQRILKLTAEAYRLLEQQSVSRYWSEDTFRIKLVERIKYLIHEHRIMDMKVESPKPLYTEKMLKGLETPKKAVEPDICIGLADWLRFEDDFYFAWECKLVADITTLADKVLKDRHKHLNSEYVIEGMTRFLDEHWKYSSEVDDAGMLGFVLHGEANKIVEAINQTILNPPSSPKTSTSDQRRLWALLCAQMLSQADHLKVCNPSPIEDFVIYQSEHQRIFCGRAVQLYHFFLTFDFDDHIATHGTDA